MNKKGKYKNYLINLDSLPEAAKNRYNGIKINVQHSKFYKESPDDFDYDIVETDKKELIGKKIYVRSAVTCCLGDKVCPRCVGRTSSTNFDIADGVSVFEAEEVTRHNLVTLNLSNCGDVLVKH